MLLKHKEDVFLVDYYKTRLQQIKGLMFKFLKNDGALFEFKKEKYIALHTFFVLTKLDIIYLNKNKEIIKIRKNILPFTIYIPHVKCKYILELKNSKNLKIKEKLNFKDV